jgi:hypothetical protein
MARSRRTALPILQLHHKHVELHPGASAEAFELVEKLPICNYRGKVLESHQLVSATGEYETDASEIRMASTNPRRLL